MPLLDRQAEQEDTESEEQQSHPGCGLTIVAGIRTICERKHDCTNRGQSHTPRHDKRRTFRAPSIGADHEHDGDDRNWKDGDGDREGQHNSQCSAHRPRRYCSASC